MGRKSYSLLLVVTFLLASACSSTRIAYNNADWFLLDKVDDFFNLSNQQEEILEQDIADFLQWHRNTELPVYQQFLTAVSDDYIDGLSEDEFIYTRKHLSAARNRVIEKLIPPFSHFLASVTAVQINHYDRVVTERLNEKRELLALSDEQYNKKFFNDFMGSLNSWFGRFSDSQRLAVKTVSARFPDNRKLDLMRNEKYHQQFMQLLRNKPASSDIDSFLRALFFPVASADTAQKETERLFKETWKSGILEIDGLMTQKQRQRAITKLLSFRDDFLVLSQQ